MKIEIGIISSTWHRTIWKKIIKIMIWGIISLKILTCFREINRQIHFQFPVNHHLLLFNALTKNLVKNLKWEGRLPAIKD